MCGHVGCAGQISAKEEKIFKQLLILDTLRGEDSTGVASVNLNGDVSVAKVVGDPFQLFDTSAYTAITRTSNRVLIGHNRYATQGKVNRKNAHPFELDTLVGAHNGTLTNKWELRNGSKFDVDSEALYNDIEEVGLEKAIGSAKGAWALVWWDKATSKLNFLRNKERPLHFIYSKDKKVMFWASEAWMLTAIINREGYEHGPINEFKEDTHYSFDIDLKSYNEMGEIAKPRLKTILGKKEVAVVHQMGKSMTNVRNLHTSHDGFAYLGSRDVEFKALSIKRDLSGSEYYVLLDANSDTEDVRLYVNNKNGNLLGTSFIGDVMATGFDKGVPYFKVSPWSVKPVVVKPKGVDGEDVSKEDFEKKYHTCAWCSSSIKYGEECHIFDNVSGILCEACIVEPEVAKYIR